MAAPVIDSIAVAYPSGQTTLAPGQAATITVTAHDPDTQTVTVSVTVTDAEGHTGTGSTSVLVVDPMTYSATAPSGTVTGGGTSNVLIFTA